MSHALLQLRSRLVDVLRWLLRGKTDGRPKSDLIFLQNTGNYREFSRKLDELGIPSDSVKRSAQLHARCWFDLARDHLADAKAAASLSRNRAAYSRSYYAAYNASKAVRYLHEGWVSLKGDDHGKAPELPDDFPSVDIWSARITNLYRHRLRADYDNWSDSWTLQKSTVEECVYQSEQFVEAARVYIEKTYSAKW